MWNGQADLKRTSRQVPHDVLRRMVSPPPPAPEDVPVTSSRAVRMATNRAADKTHDLALNVMGLREEVVSLEDMLTMPGTDDILIGIKQQDMLIGLVSADLQLRAALGEVQTIGHILQSTPEARPATATDCAMMTPMLQAIFAHLRETAARTPLEGWSDAVIVDKRLPSTRVAGLILPETPYRVISMTIDLQIEGREGTLMLALPDHLAAVTPPPEDKGDRDWSTRFQAVVNAAPVRLGAELARFKMELSKAQAIEVGQVLPLIGCKVTSVSLRARDGRRVATARLGQSGGMRAVRIETPITPEMHDLGPADADLSAMGLIPEGDQLAGDIEFAREMDNDMSFGVDMTTGEDTGPAGGFAMMDDPESTAADALTDDFPAMGEEVAESDPGDGDLAWDLENE